MALLILYKIIWIVNAFWFVYKCVFIETRKRRAQYDWLSPSCENLQFYEKMKLFIRTSYVVFLFIKMENNNFIKERLRRQKMFHFLFIGIVSKLRDKYNKLISSFRFVLLNNHIISVNWVNNAKSRSFKFWRGISSISFHFIFMFIFLYTYLGNLNFKHSKLLCGSLHIMFRSVYMSSTIFRSIFLVKGSTYTWQNTVSMKNY